MNVITAIEFFIIISSAHCKPFPFKEFFRFSKMSKSEEEAMKVDMLCTYGNPNLTLCDCKPSCIKYQTCCIDYAWDVANMTSLTSYIKTITSKRFRQVRCTPILTGLPSNHETETLLMIYKCPKQTDKRTKSKCRNKNVQLLPVLGVDGYVYRNEFCAKCHNVDNFAAVSVKADCKNKLKVKNDSSAKPKSVLEEYSKCSIKFTDDPKQFKFVKQCNMATVSKCVGKSNSEDCRLCRFYNAGVYTGDSCCKNPHCCRQGNSTKQQPEECFHSYPAFARRPTGVRGANSLPQYSLLLTFKNIGESSQRCGLGYVRKGSACIKDVAIIPGDGTGIPQNLMTMDAKLQSCLGTNIYIVLRANVSEGISISEHLGRIPSLNSNTYNIEYENKTHTVLKLQMTVYENISHHIARYIHEEFQTSVPVVYHNALYGMDFTRSFSEAKICASPIIHTPEDFEMSNESNCDMFLNGSKILSKDYVILKNKQFRLITCDTFHLSKPCPIRTIKNYTILGNKTIFTDDDISYGVEDYTPRASGVDVCVEETRSRPAWMDIVAAVDGYVTIIGCALSIIAYIWIIVTYSMIRELRTMSGKNITCLCAMLLMCDVLMLCSTIKVTCKYVAILLHFFALSVQTWSVVTAYDIWSTFQNKSLSRNRENKVRFLFHCLFAWLCPLGFVLLSIILEESKMATVGYGKYGVCWITNLAARITTYIAPVGIMICFTVSVLTYTIARIYRQCNKSMATLQKRGGENVNVARMTLKLVILLGGIEILGFFQFGGDKEVNWIFTAIFQLAYSFTRSFRGVCIWYLYVITDRVIKIYRSIRESRSYRSSTKLTGTSMGHTRTSSLRSNDNVNLITKPTSL